MDTTERSLFTETLRAGAAAIGVPLTEARIDACAHYTDLLLETNAHTNLTRITAPTEVAVKHFVDSLTIFAALPELPQGATVADVGTGAGFPGVVLKIVRPDLHLVLIDSLAKRLTFLRSVVDTLEMTDVALLHARAEEAGRDPTHRDACDLVVARAVAALPVLLEWCGPLVRPGGRFLAMKSSGVDDELTAAGSAATQLKLRQEKDTALTLPTIPDSEEPPAGRRLIVYRKISPTPQRFPRRAAEIKAKPLS